MYQAIYYDRMSRACWLRDDSIPEGRDPWLRFTHQPTYYKEDPHGPFTTLTGQTVRAVKRINRDEEGIWEKDIDGTLRVLTDYYLESDEVSKDHRTVFFDIEIKMGGALTIPYIESAPMPMTSVALYDQQTKQYYILIWDEKNQLGDYQQEGVELRTYKTEMELLRGFLNLWKILDPTIMVGFNNDFFDNPYLYYRLRRVLGESAAKQLSPIGIVEKGYWNYDPKAGYDARPKQLVKIGGIASMDMMRLDKKFVPKKRPKSSLDYIGTTEIGLGKIKYSGNLDKLFATDPKKFIDYNLRDVEIIVKLEEAKQYVMLALQICHIAHTSYENIYYSSLVLDGVIYTALRRKGIISPNKPVTNDPTLSRYYVREDEDIDDDEADKAKFLGGYVKPPMIGLHDWLTDEDLEALYPSTMMTMNISPETIIGRVVDTDVSFDDSLNIDYLTLDFLSTRQSWTIEKITGERATINTDKLLKIIEKNNYSISGNGILFDTSFEGILTEILSQWVKMRKDYKNKMFEAGKAENWALEVFYDLYQKVYKVFSNSIYGCLALPSFRYTDPKKWCSTATTSSGRVVTKSSIIEMNKDLNEELGTTDMDFVVASDTDSMFLKCFPLVQHRSPGVDINDEERIIPIIKELAKELQERTNKRYDQLAIDKFNVRRHFFKIKPEFIIRKAYWSDKKKYACLIVQKEGSRPEPGKEYDFKGLDMMKSNFPIKYQNFMRSLFIKILHGATRADIDQDIVAFKAETLVCPVEDIATPVGIKELPKYKVRGPRIGMIFSEIISGATAQARAAIYYNDLIEFNGYTSMYGQIQEGDNIRWTYLTKNSYNIDKIAFTGETDPPEIMEFINTHADRELNFESNLKKKVQKIYTTVGWGEVVSNPDVLDYWD